MHEYHGNCGKGDAGCSLHHRPDPFTADEVAEMAAETFAWAVLYGGFKAQSEVPRSERPSVITKMVAELEKARAAEGPSTKGSGVAYDLPDRVRELYAPVDDDPRPLECPLAEVLNGTGGSVFGLSLEELR